MSVPPVTSYNIRLASAAFEALRGRPSSTDLISEHIKEVRSVGEEMVVHEALMDAVREHRSAKA